MKVPEFYTTTADELTNRILKLMHNDPLVQEITDPWDLFHAGLKCDDLEPTLFQASWALCRAKRIFNQDKAD